MNFTTTAFAALLTKAGFAYREARVINERRVIVSCHCENTARDVARFLANAFSDVRVVPSLTEAKENKHTATRPTMIQIWLVGGVAR